MKICILLYLLAGGVIGCLAEVNISNYIYWKKADINLWHQFFPSRYIEEERLTIKAASGAESSLSSTLQDSLHKTVSFQYRELEIAYQLMTGTPAEGCLNGISHVLDNAIEDQVEAYQDCSGDAQSKLSRFSNNLVRLNSTYQTAYQRALVGIDTCAKTYPNKDSVDRLRSCIESINNNYFKVANDTQSSVFPSHSMTFFKGTVVECASKSNQAVNAKGLNFLKMLVNCASLSGTVDPTVYADELSQWKGYNDTLIEQINTSLDYDHNQIQQVETYMKNFYLLQKQALEMNVIETRGMGYFLDELYSHLADYYNTVTSTTLDNPGESECVAEAKTSLNTAVNANANTLIGCDEVIVSNTKLLVTDIRQHFVYLNDIIPSVGNVAILNCIAEGYIFAPDTIQRCFKLTSSQFEADFSDTYDVIAKDTTALVDLISTFFNNTSRSCGNFNLKRVFLGADKVLFDLQRCIYKSSGDVYEVTTPTHIYVTTISTPINSTSTQYPLNNTTTQVYNNSTHYPYYNTTAIYNSTTQYPYYNTTAVYNTTTQNPYYNTTSVYNSTTHYPYHNTTAVYKSTTQYPYYNTTAVYNNTTHYPYYNTTAVYNNTTHYPYHNTTAVFNSTTQYPYYNTTSVYNTTTQYPYLNTTAVYNSTTQYPYYNTTAVYNSTTQYPYYNTTTVHNSTTQYPYYNTTAVYNTTTQYSKTTELFPTTTKPVSKSTTPPPFSTTKQGRRRMTTRSPRRHIPRPRSPFTVLKPHVLQY